MLTVNQSGDLPTQVRILVPPQPHHTEAHDGGAGAVVYQSATPASYDLNEIRRTATGCPCGAGRSDNGHA